MTLTQIPLSEIDESALPRDRTHMNGQAMEELRLSIYATGLRTPIEVFELREPDETHKYALISGLRRLTAMRQNASEWADAPTQVDAFIRQPRTMTDALKLVLEENELRADPSPWERGEFALAAVEAEIFDTIDAAARALYPAANRMKQTRIRWCAEIVKEFRGKLAEPHTWSLRRLQLIYFAMINSYTELMHQALDEHPMLSPAEQWERLRPYTEEARIAPVRKSGKPKRASHLKPRLNLRRDQVKGGYRIWVTGRQATDDVLDEMFAMLEGRFG